jgi:hypothetical protein
MTPPPELLGGLKRLPLIGPVLASNGQRRALFGVAVALCAALTLFPQQYRAAATLSPSDPSALGLQATLGQLGAFNTVFGNQAAIEIALRIARSTAVRDKVATRLDLDRRLGTGDRVATSRWLASQVNIRALRGGIVQIELTMRDAELARSIIAAWSEATRAQLAEISVRQTAYKREVLEKLVAESTARMNKAQAAYDAFRLGRRTPEPYYELATISARIEAIRSAIKGKEVQIASALQFATPDNLQIRQMQAEMNALRGQLAQALSLAKAGGATDTLGSAVGDSTRLVSLERELSISRSLYDSYSRFLQGTLVEDLTSTANVRLLELPYVDTARQLNLVPLAAGVLLLLLALAFEMQALRRPVGLA